MVYAYYNPSIRKSLCKVACLIWFKVQIAMIDPAPHQSNDGTQHPANSSSATYVPCFELDLLLYFTLITVESKERTNMRILLRLSTHADVLIFPYNSGNLQHTNENHDMVPCFRATTGRLLLALIRLFQPSDGL
jgi:hypothetical protein